MKENESHRVTELSLADDFREVEGLGADKMVAFLVKGINTPELLARRGSLATLKKGQRRLYEPLRFISPPTSVMMMPLRAIADSKKALWKITGRDPRDIIVREDVILVTFPEEIVIVDPKTG